MKNVFSGRRSRLAKMVLGCLVVALLSSSAGCEPLRKKFTRKKKESAEKEFIPVLVPDEYPAAVKTVDGVYRQYYSMWQVWCRDAMTNIDENASDKRLGYSLNKMVGQMEGMSELLVGKTQQQMAASIAEARQIVILAEEQESVRNKSALMRQLRTLDKKVRKDFRPAQVGGSLATVLPAQP